MDEKVFSEGLNEVFFTFRETSIDESNLSSVDE